MTGTIIENLSGRKLVVLVSFLLLCQIICCLIGGLVAPILTNAQTILGTACEDSTAKKYMGDTKVYHSRGPGSCKTVSLGEIHHESANTDIDIVFVFQIPISREGETINYSRWQQYLIGLMEVDLKYYSRVNVPPPSIISIDARLAYRNKGDPEDKWTLSKQSIEHRPLECDTVVLAYSHEYLYTCSAIPLFEFGSLFHDYYLLNVRLPIYNRGMYSLVSHIQDIWMTFYNQNGEFTKVWLALKIFFLPCIIATLVWFWTRIQMLARKPVLLEKMFLSLGISLCFLNLPIEYLTLHFDLPFMLLLDDIRQGAFYATLFSFWLVFAGEHMLIHEESSQSSLKQYWRHLSGIAMGCVSLFIFDICKRGPQVRDPFHSIWATNISTNLALAFIIVSGISAGVYFLFLCYKTWQAFSKISHKTESLATMYSVGRLRSEGIIYRFKGLMLVTLICAGFTVIEFILGQVARGQWKWHENSELENTSAFFTGVYGMWNIYIFALMVLHAPSDIQNLPQS